MIVRLPVGRERIMVDLRGLRVRHLRPMAPERHPPAAELLARALDAPIASPGLEAICRGKRRIVSVVPDATRKAEIPSLLPLLVERIRCCADDEAELSVLVACGTHPKPDSRALFEILGDLPPGVRVACHDSRSEGQLRVAGSLSDGVPVRLNRVLLDAEVVLSIGAVKHHYFAGFGGGPKMIFPGCAGHDEIQRNHSRVLQSMGADWQPHPHCQPGVLYGNPVAEEIACAAALRPPDFAVSLVCDGTGKVAWVGCGGWQESFAAAVEIARQWYEIPPQRFRYLVASGGGHPSDHTLIQAHKGLDAAVRFLTDDGELLYLASLAGGLGSNAMTEFVGDPQPEKLLERLRQGWVQYGHTTLRIVDKTRRHCIWMYSRMAEEWVTGLGFRIAHDPAEVVNGWRERDAGATVGVMTGAAVFPQRT